MEARFIPATRLSSEERRAVAKIFTRKYYDIIHSHGTDACGLVLTLFKNTGILEALKKRRSGVDELMTELNFMPDSRYAFDWMLRFLGRNGLLSEFNEGGVRRYRYDGPGGSGIGTRHIAGPARLMEYIISEYPDYFRWLKKGFEILFCPDKAGLWEAYLGDQNSVYAAHNSLGTFGFLKWAGRGNKFRVLELGVKAGSAGVSLINALKEKGLTTLIEEYVFSDDSPMFLRLGNLALMPIVESIPRYRVKRIDLDKQLTEQGINEASMDVVYGVNALHAAKDLALSLKYIRQVLKPGGMVILSEGCRPDICSPLYYEFIFNLMDCYSAARLNDKLRPVPGSLDCELWKRNLDAAGFGNIEAVLNTDAEMPQMPGQKIEPMAVVIKEQKVGVG